MDPQQERPNRRRTVRLAYALIAGFVFCLVLLPLLRKSADPQIPVTGWYSSSAGLSDTSAISISFTNSNFRLLPEEHLVFPPQRLDGILPDPRSGLPANYSRDLIDDRK